MSLLSTLRAKYTPIEFDFTNDLELLEKDLFSQVAYLSSPVWDFGGGS